MVNVKNMCDNCRNCFQTCEGKFFQMNPTWCKYFLHTLQGQSEGVNFLIFDLKSPIDTECIIFCGTKDTKLQIFVPK